MRIMMESIQKNNSVINEMLFRLERNHTEIQMLLGKLNSYTCEPTNYEYFERLRDLRDEIEFLRKKHLELFRTIDLKKLSSEEDLVAQMKNQISSFKELDRKIGAYLLDTSGH